MSEEVKNPNAFPTNENNMPDSGQGMSLRDYFAGKAMQATRSNPKLLQVVKDMAKDNDVSIYALLAEMSYEMAEAMLRERHNWM